MESIHMLAQTSTLTTHLAMDLLVKSHLKTSALKILKLVAVVVCLTSTTTLRIEIIRSKLKEKQVKANKMLKLFELSGYKRIDEIY